MLASYYKQPKENTKSLFTRKTNILLEIITFWVKKKKNKRLNRTIESLDLSYFTAKFNLIHKNQHRMTD